MTTLSHFRSLRLPILALATLYGQTEKAQLSGTITDKSNAAIPGANISVTNSGTGIKRTTQTNETGLYVVPFLDPGTYEIVIQKDGFRTLSRAGIKLDVAQIATITFVLEVGAVTETVDVKAQAPLLDSGTASLGQVIETKQFDELPLNGRNAYSFATLAPGVRASSGFSQVAYDMFSDQFLSINGSRPNQNQFLMDGGSNTTAGFNGPGLYPSVDMVQEYVVQTNNFSAEFSNTSGGVVNVVTKSGTNVFHGVAYEFLRNDKLNANDFFDNRAGNPQAPLRFNQFGGTLGGPVVKNRTFFFFAYEGVRWIQGFTANGTLATSLQRNGDFSQTKNQAGQVVTIYDPFTNTADPNRAGGFLRSPFPGNVIPQNRIDPVAVNLVKLLPMPNTIGAQVTGANNFVSNYSAPTNENLYSIRLDHSFTDNQKLFFRLSANNTSQNRPNIYGPGFERSVPVLGNDTLLQRQLVLDYTKVLSPSTVVELNSSFLHYYITRQSPGLNFDPVQLGFPDYFHQLQPRLVPCFPTVSVSGMGVSLTNPNIGGGFLGSCANLGNYFDTFHEAGNLTKTRGSHTFKAGFDYGVYRWSARNFSAAGQSYTFSPNFTQGPNPLAASSNAGLGFASFLLGNGSGSITSDGPGENMETIYWGVYFQDDWRVTPKLTFNLGIRYDNPRPWTERFNRITSWCGTCPVTVAGLSLQGGLSFPGVNGHSRYLYNTDNNNVTPRLGFSYAVNTKTVVRGGGGLFYGPVQGGAFNGTSTPNTGFAASTTWVGSVDGITPTNPLSNPYPTGFVRAPGSQLGLLSQLGQNVIVMDPNRVTPYSTQWNLDVQRTAPGNFVLDVAYTGNRGLHLFGPLSSDQLPNSVLSQGAGLTRLVTNPFYGTIATGALSTPQIQLGQLLRPYPQFGFVTFGNSSYGASTYHALEIKATRRFSAGFSMMFAYTFSKVLDDVVASTAGGGFPGETFGDATLQDFANRRLERAPAQFDTPQSLTLNSVYELPFGPNKRWFSANRRVGWILGGWQLSGIATYHSGVPLSLRMASNTLGNYGGAQRPNWNGQDPYTSGSITRRINDYFNTAAFSTPGSYAYGNTARLLSWLRAPAYGDLDLAIDRTFRITERVHLQFRSEAFNLLNQTVFGLPGTSIGSATAGVISTQANTPRNLQFALKLIF
jgi:outer membrane receptor protein involved in Fe transport